MSVFRWLTRRVVITGRHDVCVCVCVVGFSVWHPLLCISDQLAVGVQRSVCGWSRNKDILHDSAHACWPRDCACMHACMHAGHLYERSERSDGRLQPWTSVDTGGGWCCLHASWNKVIIAAVRAGVQVGECYWSRDGWTVEFIVSVRRLQKRRSPECVSCAVAADVDAWGRRNGERNWVGGEGFVRLRRGRLVDEKELGVEWVVQREIRKTSRKLIVISCRVSEPTDNGLIDSVVVVPADGVKW